MATNPKISIRMPTLTSHAAQTALNSTPTFSLAATGNRTCAANIVGVGNADVSTSREFGIPVLDYAAFDSRQCPEQLIDIKLLRKHQVLPLFKRGNRLFLAAADPANSTALNDIKFHTGLQLDVVLVAASSLKIAIERFIQRQEVSQPLLQSWAENPLDEMQIEPAASVETEESAIDEAPIVRFVNKLLLDAVEASASDIHIEPYERSYRIRFRIDGILHEITRPPIRLAGRIAARIKVMAQLDFSEKRLPQDGRIKVRFVQNRAIDLRVSILPTLWGEKMVLRLLDPNSSRLGIDALGFELQQKLHYLQALQKSQGLILVTGPTGSGKSVTLYTGLNILNSSERNIATAEDPVELNIDGLNQVCVNTKCGFDFAAALRAFLRQDPDVIMVGEIRDLETADTAIKAAQTGHLVLSTLHTNGAAETVARLLHMGIAPFNLASSLSLIIAQKLARRLCIHCKESVSISENVLKGEGFSTDLIAELQLYRATGCDKCKNGYKGRIGIFEVVPITPALIQSIMSGAGLTELGQLAKAEGFATLRHAALNQVARGQISLEEANRLA